MPRTQPMCALVPFRSMSQTKQRLRPLLPAERCDALALAMLRDTIAALRVSALAEDIYIVSQDSRELAGSLGADVQCLQQCDEAHDLNSAVQSSLSALTSRYAAACIVHADLPLLAGEDIDIMLAAYGNKPCSIVIAPDRHRDGSNCLMLPLGEGFALHYGPGSYAKHLAEAKRLGLHVSTESLFRASVDIDNPTDLDCLRKQRILAGSHVQSWLDAESNDIFEPVEQVRGDKIEATI